jgi:hypothetical protein
LQPDKSDRNFGKEEFNTLLVFGIARDDVDCEFGNGTCGGCLRRVGT